MCNIREALAVCCLFLNTVDCIIFSLIPKLVPNLDSNALNDPTNFVTGGLGQVLKDGTSSLPLVGNSLGSATNSGRNKDEFLSGNFGIEIPFQNVQKTQNEMEIPSPFNLGLLPSNTRQVQNSEGPKPVLRSNFNDFDYQIGKVPSPPNLPHGQPPSSSRNLDYQIGKVPPPSNFPNGQLPSQQSVFNEIENNSDPVPASSSNSNGPSCDVRKQSTNNEANFLKTESPPILPSSRFLNLENSPKGPIASLKISGDIYLNSDNFSIKPSNS